MSPVKIGNTISMREKGRRDPGGSIADIDKILGKEQETDRSWILGRTFSSLEQCPSWCSLSSDCQPVFSIHTMVHKLITYFFLEAWALSDKTESYWMLFFPDMWTTHMLSVFGFCTSLILANFMHRGPHEFLKREMRWNHFFESLIMPLDTTSKILLRWWYV